MFMASEAQTATYSVASERHGDLDASDLATVLTFIDAPAYGPGRNFVADSLKSLAVGEPTHRIDGYGRRTTIRRES